MPEAGCRTQPDPRDTCRGRGAAPQNPPGPARMPQPARYSGSPSLAGALAVTFRLVRIHPAHALEQILRVGLGDVGRFRPAAVALLRAPRCGADWALRPVRHARNVERRAAGGGGPPRPL